MPYSGLHMSETVHHGMLHLPLLPHRSCSSSETNFGYRPHARALGTLPTCAWHPSLVLALDTRLVAHSRASALAYTP